MREGFRMASGRVWEAANFEMLVSGAPGARNQHLGRTDGGLNFQAVIKSAASAASLMAWELHGSARTTASAGGRRLRGTPMQLPSHQGGCASSRLDHGLKVKLSFDEVSMTL